MTRLLQRSKLYGAVGAVFLLAGCADYMNHRDTVSLGAGNAQEANAGIHEIDPWPPEVFDTNIEIDGKRLPQGKRRK